MNSDSTVIRWLLEDNNPAIQYRCRTELLGEKADKQAIIAYVESFLPENWREAKGLWFTYYLNAIVECGLTAEHIAIPQEKALRSLQNEVFDFACGDFMRLRALVMLGYGGEPAVAARLAALKPRQLPDGGFLCLHRLDKMKYTPKSCVKSNNLALLLCAECHKRGVALDIVDDLLAYYWAHNLFYKTADLSALILQAREGWRTVDTFYPFEVMRVGLQNMVEAFSALGYGSDNRLHEAWELLDSRKNDSGQYGLDRTLTKSYLPKERAGKPSKWVTFYALLAQKNREITG